MGDDVVHDKKIRYTAKLENCFHISLSYKFRIQSVVQRMFFVVFCEIEIGKNVKTIKKQ